jgi:NADPH:quinone reductase-like Zn-dependent oxidoreductase
MESGRRGLWTNHQVIWYVTPIYIRLTIAAGSMQIYVAVSSSTAMTRKPSNLSWEQAAAIPLVYMTVYGCLIDIGHLPLRPSAADKGKNSVLILGGSGGAGSQAIQLAKMMGLNVVTSCSIASEGLVKKLGADEVS